MSFNKKNKEKIKMIKKRTIKTQEGPGRPPCKIDWKKVDFLLKAGCSGTDVAAELGIHPETLYRRCEEKNKTNFSHTTAHVTNRFIFNF